MVGEKRDPANDEAKTLKTKMRRWKKVVIVYLGLDFLIKVAVERKRNFTFLFFGRLLCSG